MYPELKFGKNLCFPLLSKCLMILKELLKSKLARIKSTVIF